MARKNKASENKDISDEVLDPRATEEIDPKIYNEIAKCAELLSVQLIQSDFSISPRFFENEDEGNLALNFANVHGAFDEKSRVTTCIFQFESIRKKGNKKLFSLKSTFAVFYQIEVDCDETHAVAFSRKTGLMACYPYFRSHAAHITSFANADMPILPTISSNPVQRNAKKEKVQ